VNDEIKVGVKKRELTGFCKFDDFDFRLQKLSDLKIHMKEERSEMKK